MFRYWCKSDVGLARDKNEDYYIAKNYENSNRQLFIIADGMGGHLAGEVASQMSCENAKNFIEVEFEKHTSINYENLIKNCIIEANKNVYDMANSSDEKSGMGSTIVLALFEDEKVHIGNVGDSRVYRFRKGKLQKLTKDHSLVEELLESGTISLEEAKLHPQRNVITRAVGFEREIEVDYFVENVKDDDLYLLCTDGLSNYIDDEKLTELLKITQVDEISDVLIKIALRQGGKDNITVVVAAK